MSIGKILGALSPGLSATGLFGHQAQSGGTAALSAMSPMLALLLHHKKNGSAPVQTPAAPATANVPNGDVLAPQAATSISAPSLQQTAASIPQAPNLVGQQRRKQIGLNLMQLGPQLFGGGYGY